MKRVSLLLMLLAVCACSDDTSSTDNDQTLRTERDLASPPGFDLGTGDLGTGADLAAPRPDAGPSVDQGPTPADMTPGGDMGTEGDQGPDFADGGADMPRVDPPGCDDRFEPNEDKAGATRVQLGQRLDELTICGMSSDDQDLFEIELQAGQRIEIVSEFINNPPNIDTTLFRADQEILRSSIGVAYTGGFSDGETLSYEVPAQEGGTYYLLVFANFPADAPYSIVFRLAP